MTLHAKEDADYAPSAGPVTCTAIHTDLNCLDIVASRIDSNGFALPLYAAWPEHDPHRDVVLVICEAFGLHEHIKDIVRRFAKAGYFALAPDLMVRHGDPMAFGDVDALVRDSLVKIPDPQVMTDLDNCVAWAKEQGGDICALSATGFCWGGRWKWLYAAHRQLQAAVAWYGIIDGRSTGMFPADIALFPTHPIDVVGNLKAPVLGLYGGADEAIPIVTVNAMRQLLALGNKAARKSELHIYPEAGHAFFADYRESYAPEAARDGWRRCLDFIRGQTCN
jgi:carboxymethylenebutenolidase